MCPGDLKFQRAGRESEGEEADHGEYSVNSCGRPRLWKENQSDVTARKDRCETLDREKMLLRPVQYWRHDYWPGYTDKDQETCCDTGLVFCEAVYVYDLVDEATLKVQDHISSFSRNAKDERLPQINRIKLGTYGRCQCPGKD